MTYRFKSVEEMIGRFTSELLAKLPDWKNELMENPQQLEEVEKTVHQSFARGADMLVAGLMSIVVASSQFEDDSEKTRSGFSRPLGKGREQTVRIRLLGGLLLWATTLYCPPKKRFFRKDKLPRVGLNVTLAQFGFWQRGLARSAESRRAPSCVVSFDQLCP